MSQPNSDGASPPPETRRARTVRAQPYLRAVATATLSTKRNKRVQCDVFSLGVTGSTLKLPTTGWAQPYGLQVRS
eukprot:9808581-Lingulodinium_polyedra.AAC.1